MRSRGWRTRRERRQRPKSARTEQNGPVSRPGDLRAHSPPSLLSPSRSGRCQIWYPGRVSRAGPGRLGRGREVAASRCRSEARCDEEETGDMGARGIIQHPRRSAQYRRRALDFSRCSVQNCSTSGSSSWRILVVSCVRAAIDPAWNVHAIFTRIFGWETNGR